VFLSIFEHNSNLLPWRETGAQIELIPMTEEGDFDYEYLESRFKELSSKKCLKIGAFSAGSNITGNVFDTDRIAIICHKNNALAVFDYAAVAPYVEMNMNGIKKNRPFEGKIE
jgi:selenocysteine lyase/cysteine desulfurase